MVTGGQRLEASTNQTCRHQIISNSNVSSGIVVKFSALQNILVPHFIVYCLPKKPNFFSYFMFQNFSFFIVGGAEFRSSFLMLTGISFKL